MARITITERDLTVALPGSVAENIAYVPGYAVKGPVNTPTLVRSVGEFTSIFGTRPYRFKSNNKYEKSFVYAIELLRDGLPIMYERIAKVDSSGQVTIPTAKGTIQFKNSTLEGQTIQTEVTSFELGEKVEATQEFTSAILEELTDLQVFIDGEQILSTKFSVSTDTIEITDASVGQVTITGSLITPNEWKVVGSNSTNTLVWVITKNGSPYSTGQVERLTTNRIKLTTDIFEREFNVDFVEGTINTTNKIEIYAKYPGAYGDEITVAFRHIKDDGERLYGLTINSERELIVTLNENSDDYIGKVISPIVDIEPILNSQFIELNLFTPVETPQNLVSGVSGQDEITVADIITELKKVGEDSLYGRLEDKIAFDIKFITSGAYPSIESSGDSTIARNILRTAANRTDSLGLIELEDTILPKEALSYINEDKLFLISDRQEDGRKYGTIVYPSGQFRMNTEVTSSLVETMPGSFAYLKSLANSQRSNPNWFAIAGPTRGLIPGFIQPTHKVNGVISDLWQRENGFNINPVLYIRPHGYCIWGNRTLNDNIRGLTASSFTNIRVLSSDIKKVIIDAAQGLIFEINDDILWNKFKTKVETELDRMATGRGIRDYKLIRLPSTRRATVNGLVRIVPIEAVEDFDITFTLEDSLTVVQ